MATVASFDQLTYLDLSHIECSALPYEAKSLLERCPNLYQLNLSHCGLQSLDNLPNIEITVLELASNNISDKELHKLNIYRLCL